MPTQGLNISSTVQSTPSAATCFAAARSSPEHHQQQLGLLIDPRDSSSFNESVPPCQQRHKSNILLGLTENHLYSSSGPEFGKSAVQRKRRSCRGQQGGSDKRRFFGSDASSCDLEVPSKKAVPLTPFGHEEPAETKSNPGEALASCHFMPTGSRGLLRRPSSKANCSLPQYGKHIM